MVRDSTLALKRFAGERKSKNKKQGLSFMRSKNKEGNRVCVCGSGFGFICSQGAGAIAVKEVRQIIGTGCDDRVLHGRLIVKRSFSSQIGI
jgi:hypothetical protein